MAEINPEFDPESVDSSKEGLELDEVVETRTDTIPNPRGTIERKADSKAGPVEVKDVKNENLRTGRDKMMIGVVEKAIEDGSDFNLEESRQSIEAEIEAMLEILKAFGNQVKVIEADSISYNTQEKVKAHQYFLINESGSAALQEKLLKTKRYEIEDIKTEDSQDLGFLVRGKLDSGENFKMAFIYSKEKSGGQVVEKVEREEDSEDIAIVA